MARSTIIRPVSIPPELWVLWEQHRAALPALSSLAVEAMEAALRAAGVEPPPRPEPGRMAAAHEARRKALVGPPEPRPRARRGGR